MSKAYSAYKWSNCLIEAVKAWVKDHSIKLYFLPSYSDKIPLFHIAWSDGKAEYSFEGYHRPRHWYTTLWYYGCIRKHNIGWANKYIWFIEHKRAHTLPGGMDVPDYGCRFTLTAPETKQ